MESIEFDALERHKARVNLLRGSLSRELLRAIAARLEPVFPTATHMHIVLYPDNVYRIWAVTEGKKWLAVCEDDVAPSWTSINLDDAVDLVMRLKWTPRIRPYQRADGVEVHSVVLRPQSERKKRARNGQPRPGRLDQVQVPHAEVDRPVQGRE